jgi:Winged helix DNA-binding domain
MPRFDPVLGERIARHGFVDRRAAGPADAAGLVVGLQAQDPAAGRLGVRSRLSGTSDAQVRSAIDSGRSLIKTSLMRATIHLVATDDVRWLTALFGPVNARGFAKRWRDLGLTSAVLSRTLLALADILSDSPMTRPEIMAALATHGIAIDTSDQAPHHVLFHAATEGLVCRGADCGREATFVRLDAWVPDAPAGPRGDDALAEIARRYFRAFSPATAPDFTTWSGLPSSRAIELIRDELTPIDVGGRPGYRLGEVTPQRGVRLLSAFDNYLIGYAARDAIIADDRRREVYVGGIIRPTVLVDGRVAGRWQWTRGRTEHNAGRHQGRPLVDVLPFETFSRATARAVAAEVAEIEAFVAG